MILEPADPYPAEPMSVSEQQLGADLLRTASDAVIALDPAGHVTYWNNAAEDMFGWSAEEILGRPAATLVPPDRVEELDRLVRVLVGNQEQAAVETERVHKDGTVLPVSCRMSPLVDPRGRVYGASAILRDNSRELALRRELERGRQEAQDRFTHSSLAQLTTDPHGRITATNDAMCALGGWHSDKDLLGRPVLELMPPEDVPAALVLLRSLQSGELSKSTHRRRLRHAHGHVLETTVTVFAVRDEGGQVARLECVFQDVTEVVVSQLALLASEARSRHLALHAADVALLCDADGLITFASAAVTQQLGYDASALVGMSGFALYHPEDEPAVRAQWLLAVREHGASRQFQARVRAANSQWRWVDATVTNNLNVPGVQAMVANLVDVTGRESLTPAMADLVEDLRRGLRADELTIQYQPVLSLQDGRVVGVEALMRWRHPEQGLLAPGSFLDAAEASGLILPMGQSVLQAACEAAARWAHLGTPMKPFHVAVNLSAQQLTAPGVVDLVHKQLVRAGAQPANIMLEVTESAVMSDVDAATATLDRLRDMGIPIVVDDFGTGYSSLTYVKRFPITGLKIDRSFVGGLGVDDDDAAIVASVVSLAAAVRIDCIAEGVETEQQLAALQELDCEYAQGFLWAPALDADELEDWVRDHNPTALRQGQDTKSRRSRPTRSPASVAGQPPSAAVCTRIASLHAQGASLSTIAAALNAEGLLTTEGRRWHPRSVARALTGPRRRQD